MLLTSDETWCCAEIHQKFDWRSYLSEVCMETTAEQWSCRNHGCKDPNIKQQHNQRQWCTSCSYLITHQTPPFWVVKITAVILCSHLNWSSLLMSTDPLTADTWRVLFRNLKNCLIRHRGLLSVALAKSKVSQKKFFFLFWKFNQPNRGKIERERKRKRKGEGQK